MALFLEIHDLNGQDAPAFVAARSQARNGIRCLKHWLEADDRCIALLVEAPSEEALRASLGGAKEITELFAPAERWASQESIEMA